MLALWKTVVSIWLAHYLDKYSSADYSRGGEVADLDFGQLHQV